jgi:hypothetical protein
MSLASFRPLRKSPHRIALFAALVPFAASAQEASDASAIDWASTVVVRAWPTLMPLPQRVVAAPALLARNPNPMSAGGVVLIGTRMGDAPPPVDQVLSRQPGGRAGLVTVATTNQTSGGSAVTLWDEIAPPAPQPVPVESTRPAQSNVASNTRK